MINYQSLRHFFVIFVSLCCTVAIFAQNTTCPIIVTEALSSVADACDQIGRNQVCYGNNLIDATNRDGIAINEFATAGDTIDVETVSQLVTTPLDVENNHWGVAVMVLQADIPDTLPGQNVTFIMFGNTTITEEADDNFASPMQSFSISTGIGQPLCNEVPQDGVLIQSPDDLTVNFLMNGFEVALSSTAYIHSVDDNVLSITMLEGQAEIVTDDGIQIVEAGFTVNFADDQTVTDPQPFDTDVLHALPISLLPRPIAIPIILIAREATANWMDSGVLVEAGNSYHIRARGRTNLWTGCNNFCANNPDAPFCPMLCTAVIGGPEGTEYVTDIVPETDPFFVMQGERYLILLGRIGQGEMFVVGDELQFTAETSGTLFFRINEDTRATGDEPGAYAVSVLELEGDE